MKTTNRIIKTLLGAVVSLLVLNLTTSAATQVYDLKADWSDTQNPNGTWSYRLFDGSLLPNDAFSWGYLYWGDLYNGGEADALTRTTAASAVPGYREAGDISAITSSGVKVRWTAPANGSISVSGAIWNAIPDGGTFGEWTLTRNGNILSVGNWNNAPRSAPGDLTVGSAGATGLLNIPVEAGDQVELDFLDFRFFFPSAFGINFTVSFSLSASATQWQVYFEDDFDGSAINDSKWNTELATSGKRWCASTFGTSPPWVWQDIEVEPWMGVTETPPYGTITVGGGLASFSAGILRAFPYIWCGPPSRTSPFPATGDFIFEFRWKLDSPGQHGNGVITPFWPNTEPEGDNMPWGLGGWGLWGDTQQGWSIGSPAGLVPLLDPQGFHIFRLEYINGEYSQYVDGILSAGPTESSVRPNVIWIGNPIFASWSQPWDNWSDFTIDYIRVVVPTPGCPNASFADDAVIWHQPLARNGASEDTDPSANRTVKYRFKRGSTIPIQIHALNCAGADVASNANVIGKVTVFGNSNCDVAVDDTAAPIEFNGVGAGGGVMDKIGGHLKYNLDTKALPTTTQCYILRVTVTDTSTGEEKFEEVLLQAK